MIYTNKNKIIVKMLNIIYYNNYIIKSRPNSSDIYDSSYNSLDKMLYKVKQLTGWKSSVVFRILTRLSYLREK